MRNCGRCGKPLFVPGQAICEGCRKMIVMGAAKHADRLNRHKEMEESLVDTLSNPGNVEKDDPRYEHFVDTYDATAVWAGIDDKRKKKPSN